MTWDDDKSTAQDPDNPTADEQVTADEWDNHVADQKNHSTRHESGGTDEISLGALAGQIATGQLSDAAVTAAKIADNAVGVSELMDALGTSASNKIPGTTYFTNANVEALEAQEAETSNETRIEATRSSNSGTITAGNYVSCYDGDSTDNRSEFSNGVFTPDKTGLYIFILSVNFGGSSTTQGDQVQFRLLRQSDTTTVGEDETTTASGSFSKPTGVIAETLSAGESYDVQVTNQDNDFELNATRNNSGDIFRPMSQ